MKHHRMRLFNNYESSIILKCCCPAITYIVEFETYYVYMDWGQWGQLPPPPSGAACKIAQQFIACVGANAHGSLGLCSHAWLAWW